jgi:hypothetical protein
MLGGRARPTRLEYTADISGHRRAHDEVFAVLLHLNVLKPIEIHQQSAPFRLDAGRGADGVVAIDTHGEVRQW